MIYAKLRSVNSSATAINKSIHVTKRLVDGLIKIYEKGGIVRFQFVSKVGYGHTRE